MKYLLLSFLAALIAFNLGAPLPLHAQAEKVKQQAKDLKKNVEGGGTTETNKPPSKPSAKPAPPTPPAPPAPPAPRK